MKNLLIAAVACTVLSSCSKNNEFLKPESVSSLPENSLKKGSNQISIPKTNGSIYMLDASSIAPGTVVVLEGNYLSVQIRKIQGTAEKPIIFINKGLVTIGGNPNNTMILEGKHFKVLGNGDPKIKYGFHLVNKSVYNVGIELVNSSNVEIAYCELEHFSCGIKQNPDYGSTPMEDCFYHDNYFHDFDNPASGGRSEAFYLGSSSTSVPYNPAFRFINCRITNNIIENVSGDGIQAAVGDFIIRGNTIKNYAKAQLIYQRNGILLGGNASGKIMNNKIDGGRGNAIQILGVGIIQVGRNTISNVNLTNLSNEDIIYINAKVNTSQGAPLLKLKVHDNTIHGSTTRYGLGHFTNAATVASTIFTNNKITGINLKPYALSGKDLWK